MEFTILKVDFSNTFNFTTFFKTTQIDLQTEGQILLCGQYWSPARVFPEL